MEHPFSVVIYRSSQLLQLVLLLLLLIFIPSSVKIPRVKNKVKLSLLLLLKIIPHCLPYDLHCFIVRVGIPYYTLPLERTLYAARN